MQASIWSVLVPALVAAAATIVSAWISRPRTSQGPQALQGSVQPAPAVGVSVAPLIMGAVGLAAWLLPIIGLPLALVGLGLGVSHASSYPPKRLSTFSIYFNVVTLIASTANAAIGAYLGATGQLFR